MMLQTLLLLLLDNIRYVILHATQRLWYDTVVTHVSFPSSSNFTEKQTKEML